MKRLLALALALLILLPALASARGAAAYNGNIDPATGEYIDPMSDPPEDAPEDDGSHAYSATPLTGDNARPLAEGASALYEMIGRAMGDGMPLLSPFEGAPDAYTAWNLVTIALMMGAVEGMGEDGAVRAEDVTRAYDMIFAYGTIPPQPDEPILPREGDFYYQPGDFSDAEYWGDVVDARVEGGGLVAEVAIMEDTGFGPVDLMALLSIRLLPDDLSPFGARLAGFLSITGTGAPAFTSAEATAKLADYKKITYDAKNVLDGDLTTAWCYSEQDDPGAVITLRAEAPQTVRGIRLTPAYAKSESVARANNRVRTFRVALSDGETFDFTVQPDLEPDQFGGWASFAFDRAHQLTWLSFQVTDVYPGEKYNDTCISEIAPF